MTGYVRMCKPELKIREYDQYKGVYCSLCKRLGKRYGVLLRFALSFDMTFYALLSMALSDGCVGFTQSRCSYNPLKKCLKCDAAALDTAADITALMLYYRALDHLEDEGFLKRMGVFLTLPFAKAYHKKAKAFLPDIDEAFARMTDAQHTLEQAKVASVDAAAEPFALLLQMLCEQLAADDKQEQVLSRFGYCLGRYVYLADAAADMVDDGKKGRYNPFLLSRRVNINDVDAISECQRYATDVLRHCQAECIAAYDLLDVRRFDGILRNILERGIATTVDHLFETRKKEK